MDSFNQLLSSVINLGNSTIELTFFALGFRSFTTFHHGASLNVIVKLKKRKLKQSIWKKNVFFSIHDLQISRFGFLHFFLCR